MAHLVDQAIGYVMGYSLEEQTGDQLPKPDVEFVNFVINPNSHEAVEAAEQYLKAIKAHEDLRDFFYSQQLHP
jgi:hypothetical protein